jgi:hypothetical protein
VAHCKVYQNVPLSTGGGAAVAGPTTLTAAAAYISNGIPCKGAIAVVARLKATNQNAPQTPLFNVGNTPSRLETFLASSGIQYTAVNGNVGVRCDQTGGNTLIIERANARGIFYHDFVQFGITGHATLTITGFTVDIEVWYDFDAFQSQLAMGQGQLVPSTT